MFLQSIIELGYSSGYNDLPLHTISSSSLNVIQIKAIDRLQPTFG